MCQGRRRTGKGSAVAPAHGCLLLNQLEDADDDEDSNELNLDHDADRVSPDLKMNINLSQRDNPQE